MSLSLLVIILIPIIFIPFFVLPYNKINIIILSILFSLIVPTGFLFFNLIIPSTEFVVGRGAYPVFSWIISGYKELNNIERYHISFMMLLFIIFFFSFIVVFSLQNTYLLGKNPSIHSTRKTFTHVFSSIIAFVLVYLTISVFFISIRQIISVPDGFLEPLFNFIYKIEA